MVSASARRYNPPRSASAKLVPSAEIPKPENIRRIVTGPKSANRSIRKSRSIIAPGLDVSPHGEERILRVSNHEARIPPQPSFETPHKGAAPQDEVCVGGESILNLRGRQLYRLAATAGRDLVRIVEDELGLHLVGFVIHLGAEQEQHGLGIDQDLDAPVLDLLVGRPDLVLIFDGIGLPGAAAVLDADAQS